MKRANFNKDFIPVRPTQSKNPYTRKPRIKRVSWRRRDSSQSFIEETNELQRKVNRIEEDDDMN
jgi:hypothetical protein